MHIEQASFNPFNEIGDREVTFVLKRTWIDRLLSRPQKSHTFVQPQHGGTVWREKGTGRYAEAMWDVECLAVVERERQKGVLV